ncbi:DUF3971 domain-containing protein [Tateyamaria sp. Alg231-49]|uniref:YhdP family protein n=1 Tax=Tateyamaria sp. Alg231-49 TaxID=1922219 RepID=UPI000D55B58A|nr:DUF3971 domain-containing protein [Tateyamaria sp. Alg231-49]
MSSSEPTSVAPNVRRKNLWRRHRVGSLLTTLMFTALLGALVYVMIGRPVSAPVWLRTEIETRVADALGAASMRFDALDLVVEDGAHPQVRMTNVQLISDTGAEIAAFGEMRANLSFAGLLNGKMQPTHLSVSGVFARLRRQMDGTVVLSGGLDLSAPNRQAATLAELIAGIDTILSHPGFDALRSAEIRALTLQVEDVRANRAWTIDGGRAQLTRAGEAVRITTDLALLSGGQGVATLAANYESRMGDVAATFGASIEGIDAGDIATLAPPFAWLNVLRAPISGAMRAGVNTDGTLAPLNATLTIGAGVIQPNDAARPVPFSSARSYFNYDPAARVLTFDELSVDSAWITGRIEGQTVLGLTADGQLNDLVGQFRSSTLTANPDNLYDAPVSFEAAEMDFRLGLDPFRLDVGQAVFQDQGQTVLARGVLEAGPEGWSYGLDAQMDGILPERLLALWPHGAVPKTRAWLVDNLLGGRLRNMDAVLRDAPGSPLNAFISFDFEDAHVRYTKTLPPITEARGTASLLDNRFVVTVDAGKVIAPEGGAIDVASSSFIIPDVRAKPNPPAIVRLQTRGTVTAALAMLDAPPLSIMSKADLPTAIADGYLQAEGTLALSLRKGLKPGELIFDARGTAREVTSTRLIEGRTLATSTLEVVANNAGVEISGLGTLDGIPFQAIWEQPIGTGPQPSNVTGTMELSERTETVLGLGLPPGLLTGQGTGRIRVTLPADDTVPTFQVESDLRGIRLSSPPLGWSKAAQTPAILSVTGQLGETPRVDRLELDAPGLRASGAITLRPDGGLERARFDRVQVGQWLDAPVDLVGRGVNVPPAINVRGGKLDLRQADFGGSGSGSAGGQGGGPLNLTLDQLLITDTIRLTGLAGEFDMARGLSGKFQARINGATPIRGEVLPENGRSAIRITSDDAGGVAASAAILKQARGGTLSLTLRPVGSASFDGSLSIRETRIQDAPAIAALLNALSIVGLLEQMGGPGIHFQEVEAAFRLTPSIMTLTQASAVGPSMGLSMFGTYDVNRSILDMQGVISPLYLINGIGSILTRKGEGLIGFNYALRGAASNPQVQVNPLSALTPGMFREVFRAQPPTLPTVTNEIDPVVPEASALSEPKESDLSEPVETEAQRRMRLRQEASDSR